MNKLLIGILVLVVVSVLLLQIDDDLDPGAMRLLELSQSKGDSKAYLYLMGIVASADEDPLQVGKDILESIREGEDDSLSEKKEFECQDDPDEKKLPLPDGEAFCGSREKACLEYIFSDDYNLKAILSSHAILFDRYREYLKLNDYKTLTRPTLLEPIPHYEYIRKGNRILLLKAINTARESKLAQATEMITNNISESRSHLKQSDTLIGKMIYLTQISDNLDVLSVLIRKDSNTLKQEIKPVSLDERNFEILMSREFGLVYDMYTNLDRDSDFLKTTDDNDGYAPGWYVRTIFKPNMTSNSAYISFQNTINLSHLKQKEFAEAVLARDSYKPGALSYIRNYSGNVLNRVGGSADYNQYVARFFDINAKIALLNETAGKDLSSDTLGNIKNPYYENSNPAFFSDDGKRICLNGPLKDNRNLRCLRIKI